MKEERIAKVSFNKSGGTARGTAITNRVTIPTKWIKKMGLNENERDLILEFDEDKIIVKKYK